MSTVALFLLAVLATVSLFGQPVKARSANTTPSQYLFVFGDSYTTTGFDFTVDPQPSVENPLGNPEYPGARTSGGDIWLDVVLEKYARRAVAYNFAVGGNPVNSSRTMVRASVPASPAVDFRDQQAQFEALMGSGEDSVPWTPLDSLFISWFGINDVAGQIFQGRDFDEFQAALNSDVEDYFGLLDRQYELGARRFVTILVPPIHRAGAFIFGEASNAPEVLRATQHWNQQVMEQNRKFQRRHFYVDSRIEDPTRLFNRLLDSPEEHGAPNSTCLSFPDGQPCLWRDFIHPGVVIQEAFGKQMGRLIRRLIGPLA